ncbi:hypothetical protein LTS18_011100, partial [Coniosporium uncinatum]
GAVIFASVISCLSWSNIENAHWSGPALWYASIVFAILAVVLGSQHSMLLPDMTTQIDKDWKAIRESMTVGNADGTRRPSSITMFAWQGPTMCLSYSLVAFMAGLMSVVFSPWAQNMVWGPEAK